jgi:hypothetical protein
VKASLAFVATSLCLACGGAPADHAASRGTPATPRLRPFGASGAALAAARADAPPGVLRTAESGGDWGHDFVEALAFDASGARTLLVRSLFTGLEGYSHLERRSADGELQWERFGEIYSAAVNARGEVFIQVTREPDPAGAFRFSKLGADGQPQWDVSASGPVLPLPDGGALIVDERHGLLRRLGPDGAEGAAPLWFPEVWGRDVTVTADGGLAVSRRLTGGNTVVAKLGLDLAERWRIEMQDEIVDVVATADGGVAIAQSNAVAVLDGEGAVRFRRELPVEEWGRVSMIAAGPEGRIGLVSRLWLWPWKGLHVLDATGEVAWSSVTAAPLEPRVIAFDPSGRLAVGGSFSETEFGGQRVVPNGPEDAFYLQFEP